MRILVVNSDLAVNRGDRAIAEGLVALIRKHAPQAHITVVSQHASRDAAWLGVSALNQGVHSLNPWHLLLLVREARRSDLVLWGGGELLKDYTNKLGLWYWVVKMRAVSAAAQVVGVFQGIGPTHSTSSKRAIVSAVRRTRLFVVRDHESRDKLLDWGVTADRVVATFDSAIMAPAADTSADLGPAVVARLGVDEAALADCAAMAPRDWFHYRPGGVVPHRWRRKRHPDQRRAAYHAALVEMLNTLAAAHQRVLVIPMHLHEDVALCRALVDRMDNPAAAIVLDEDHLSPRELRWLISQARLMVALRLHAGIIATSVGVPAVTYYYVDKGRLYAHQVGLSQYASPIEDLLEADVHVQFQRRISALASDHEATTTMARQLDVMRQDVDRVFASQVLAHD